MSWKAGESQSEREEMKCDRKAEIGRQTPEGTTETERSDPALAPALPEAYLWKPSFSDVSSSVFSEPREPLLEQLPLGRSFCPFSLLVRKVKHGFKK